LSVEISKRGSSRWTLSPGFFNHLVMVPSKMDSPIWGMMTSVGIISFHAAHYDENPGKHNLLLYRRLNIDVRLRRQVWRTGWTHKPIEVLRRFTFALETRTKPELVLVLVLIFVVAAATRWCPRSNCRFPTAFV